MVDGMEGGSEIGGKLTACMWVHTKAAIPSGPNYYRIWRGAFFFELLKSVIIF